MTEEPGLYAVSDLHVAYSENRDLVVETLHPRSRGDWLIVAGDVAEQAADVEWVLSLLRERFERVIWAPGNHELWTPREDPVQLRGQERYDFLVERLRRLGVDTPEDPYPRWEGPGGPVTVAPLFLLYDYSFRAPGATTKQESLAYAHRTGIVCSDEFLLDPAPYSGPDAWCEARLALTWDRLTNCGPGPLVLVNHFPLVREPTRILRYPEFAQWCGTVRTADWHRRLPVQVVVYGHLHIPRTTWYDGVRFEEVSLGYPRERRPGNLPPGVAWPPLPRPVLVPSEQVLV